MKKVALVVGATGIVGRQLILELASSNWKVYGICRRIPAKANGWIPVSINLLDPNQCQVEIQKIDPITHVFYAARHTHVDQGEPVIENIQMLSHLLDAVLYKNNSLRHVHLVHGMKVYGSTLGPYKTPAKETDPPTMADTFYFGQQALIEDRQLGQKWTWSISRPQTICGDDISQVRNLPRIIAIYAALCKARGMRELDFPGTEKAFSSIYQVTHAPLLARAIHWMSTDEKCGNQVFNITNGDCFRWVNIWPAFCDYFGMRPGQPRSYKLVDLMAAKSQEWESLINQQQLLKIPFADASQWRYADYIFGFQYDVLSDQNKLRTYGFNETKDSEVMFLSIFKSIHDQGLTPW